MDHEMIRTDSENGVWECPSCPRKLFIARDNFKVLEQGDFGAQHFGTMTPGLYPGAIEVDQG